MKPLLLTLSAILLVGCYSPDIHKETNYQLRKIANHLENLEIPVQERIESKICEKIEQETLNAVYTYSSDYREYMDELVKEIDEDKIVTNKAELLQIAKGVNETLKYCNNY